MCSLRHEHQNRRGTSSWVSLSTSTRTFTIDVSPLRGECVAVVQVLRDTPKDVPSSIVCVCVCVCVCGEKNNIKEGDPYGSGAPVVAWGATKISAAYSACATLSGACQGRSWGPRLGQNLWWGGVM